MTDTPTTDELTVTIDLGTLERMRPRDLLELEQQTGRKFGAMMRLGADPSELDAMTVWALAFLTLRRTHPDITWDEAGRYEVAFELGDDEADDPKVSEPAGALNGSL